MDVAHVSGLSLCDKLQTAHSARAHLSGAFVVCTPPPRVKPKKCDTDVPRTFTGGATKPLWPTPPCRTNLLY